MNIQMANQQSRPRALSLRALLVIGILVAWIGGATPASAAPPENDTLPGLTLVDGQSYTVDTTEATTGPEDDGLCYTGAERSVWYQISTPNKTYAEISISTDGFDPLVDLVTGTPGSWNYEACDSGSWTRTWTIYGGTTYFLRVADWGSGGMLTVNVHFIPPPPNDTVEGAITLAGSLPITADPVDVRYATDDNLPCGQMPHGVWYRWTPTTSGRVAFSGSWTNSLAVLIGEPGAFRCFETEHWVGGYAVAEVAQGVTYTVVIGLYYADEPVTLRIEDATLQLNSFTIASKATLNTRGELTAKGTARCSASELESPAILESRVEVVQRQAGGRKVSSSIWFSITCDGTDQPWKATVSNDTWFFKSGPANVSVFGHLGGRTTGIELGLVGQRSVQVSK